MKKTIRVFLILIIICSLIASTLIGVGAVYLLRFSKSRVDDSLIDAINAKGETTFYYYDQASMTAREITNARLDSGVRFQYVNYGSIPKNLINAFIAIEDKRFFEHRGIDYARSTKAVFNYFVDGKSSFGGSTITQQLVKNLTGNNEISIQRKLSEAFAALDLEKHYDKTEILEMYLNIINLSEGCRGIGAAANFFYSKTVQDLTLSECATIAAITNNPSKYNPLRHPENNLYRRNIILRSMYDQGYITENDLISAINSPITLNVSNQITNKVNSWFIDMVIEDVIIDLCQKYDLSREFASLLLYKGGYKIYTTMVPSVQTIVEEYYSNQYNFPIDKNGDMPQSSMIIIDPNNGDIIAVAGAVGVKKGNRMQNYATSTRRPSGSAIKPLSVYAPALEKGLINWSSIVSDTPLNAENDGNPPWPSNASNTYEGNVTIKYAVQNSLNTVAVRVLNMVGNKGSLEFLRNRLYIKNLDSNDDVGDASLALGQHSVGITLRELTAAYSIFQNGIMSRPRSYFKVTDFSGRVVLDKAPQQESVISEETASIMTKLLQSVVKEGTAQGRISLTSLTEVAGKTGTTQNNQDRYFIGYTPSLIAGVWFGYEYPKPLNQFGGNFAITLWDEIMNTVYTETDYMREPTTFPIPDTVQKLSYNKNTGKVPVIYDDADDIENGWFDCHEDAS